MQWFAHPVWLWSLPIAIALGLWHYRNLHTLEPRKARFRAFWGGSAFVCFALSLSGFRIPHADRKLEVVALVDLSPSIYDRGIQINALELAAGVLPSETSLGVAVFSSNVGLERPLKSIASSNLTQQTDAIVREPWPPDLRRPQVNLRLEGSDYGSALRFARALFGAETPAHRAILLLGDGQETMNNAEAAAATLQAPQIDLLLWPAELPASGDVILTEFRVPERARIGRGVSLEVVLEGARPQEAVVRFLRKEDSIWRPIGQRECTLQATGKGALMRYRAEARIVDRLDRPGVQVYRAIVSGPEGRALPDDFTENNMLDAAVRIEGQSRWAVLANPGGTLARFAQTDGEALGIQSEYFAPEAFPVAPEAYAPFDGIMVDGLAAEELPQDSAALRALEQAVENGKGLIALGGEKAFGAGRHPKSESRWESLLPVTFLPEEDRARTILYIVDISASMNDPMPGAPSKLHFAKAQLGESVRALRPTDRVGMIAFSGRAFVVAPISPDPGRVEFLASLDKLQIENKTSFRAAFALAKGMLDEDDAEEQIAILLSDGEDTTSPTRKQLEDAVLELCPQGENKKRSRRTLQCFGIGTGPRDANEAGEETMKMMAQFGGGKFFPDFSQLANHLRSVFNEEQLKDLYVRHESFGVLPASPHEILSGQQRWPVLNFKNRVRARPESQVLLRSQPTEDSLESGSRKADPLLVLGHRGLARTAVVALSLDGAAGAGFLNPTEGYAGGAHLLGRLISYIEGKSAPEAQHWWIDSELVTAGENERLRIRLHAFDEVRKPWNTLQGAVALTGLSQSATPQSAVLRPVAPGLYEAELTVPVQGVHRLEVVEMGTRRVLLETMLATPYPQEYRRFGPDRTAMEQWVRLAGNGSRLLNHLELDLKRWLEGIERQKSWRSLRELMLLLGLCCFFAELFSRNLRRARG